MNKVEFREKAKLRIDELYHKIEFLEKQKDQISEDTKELYECRIKTLKYKRDRLQEKYQELVVVAEERWEETKDAVTHATSSVTEGVKELSDLL